MSAASDQLLAFAGTANRRSVRRLMRALETGSPYTYRERVFAAGVAATGDPAGVAAAMGYSRPSQSGYTMAREPDTAELREQRVREYEALSELKAEYVRDYLLGLLELCPTDYMELDCDGDWVIDPRQFDDLPQSVKRYVEGVEVKHARGRKSVCVRFVSKATALAIAARITTVQKVDTTVRVQLPWDQIQCDNVVQVGDGPEGAAGSAQVR